MTSDERKWNFLSIFHFHFHLQVLYVNQQAGKRFATYSTDKWLISLKYKELLQINKKVTNNLIEKCHEYKHTVHRKEYRMALNQTKRMSNLKVKIQTTLRIYFTYKWKKNFLKLIYLG